MLYLLCIVSIQWFLLILLHMRMIEKGESIDMYWPTDSIDFSVEVVLRGRGDGRVVAEVIGTVKKRGNVATWHKRGKLWWIAARESERLRTPGLHRIEISVSNTWESEKCRFSIRRCARSLWTTTRWPSSCSRRRFDIDMAHRCILDFRPVRICKKTHLCYD